MKISNGYNVLSGVGIGKAKGVGKVIVVESFNELGRVKKGDILVTKAATPDFIVILKKVACLITDEGGLTSHIAIVSRELKTSAILGTAEATKYLKTGQILKFDCKSGEIEFI